MQSASYAKSNNASNAVSSYANNAQNIQFTEEQLINLVSKDRSIRSKTTQQQQQQLMNQDRSDRSITQREIKEAMNCDSKHNTSIKKQKNDFIKKLQNEGITMDSDPFTSFTNAFIQLIRTEAWDQVQGDLQKDLQKKVNDQDRMIQVLRILHTCEDFENYQKIGMHQRFEKQIALMFERAEEIFENEINSEPNWNEQTIIYRIHAISNWARNYVNLKI